MKHLRNTTMIVTILLFLWMVLLPARDSSLAAQDPSRLSEEREKRANEHQPPQMIMDLVGIRSGLVIGEVGAAGGG